MKTLQERIDETMAPFEPLIAELKNQRELGASFTTSVPALLSMFETMQISLVKGFQELTNELDAAENRGFIKGCARTLESLRN